MLLRRDLSRWPWLLLAIGVVLAASPLYAADGTTVDFTPTATMIGQYLMVAVDVLIGGALTWVMRWVTP